MYKDKYWKHISNSYKVHLRKEKSSERAKEKHLGICTIYYSVIDLIIAPFMALVLVIFQQNWGEGEIFSGWVY